MPTQTPVSFNAQSVLTDAFLDIGVLAGNASLSPSMGQQGLRRLNNFISSLSTQPLTFPFIAREVFPIVSGQSTYTIGPGGDLDTVRPQALNGAAILLNASPQSIAITAASIPDHSFTVAGDQTAYFGVGTSFVVSGSTSNDGTYTVQFSTFNTFTVITVMETVAATTTTDGNILVATETTPVEVPRALITDDAYQNLRIKALSTSIFTDVYYNPTYARGLGMIFLWPTPNTTIHDLVLYRADQLAGFADLTTNYDFPPGYREMLEYNIAVILAISWGKPITPELRQMADDSMALIKRQNTRLTDLAIDPALTNGHQGWYNIQTGSGGGS